MRVFLASRNRGKISELGAILAPSAIELVEAPPEWISPEETGDTYTENALIKARSLCEFTGEVCIADDSGIEVYALNNAPGPRSARYAGPRADDEANLEKLVEEVSKIPEGQRGARYVCVAALVAPDGREACTEGTFEGCIVLQPRGTNGFGYDPIFGLKDDDRTAAELTPSEKEQVSHRGKAFRALLPRVHEFLTS